MSAAKKALKLESRRTAASGIVIHMRVEASPPPRVSAFIWGGKVRPVPTIPYGRRTA